VQTLGNPGTLSLPALACCLKGTDGRDESVFNKVESRDGCEMDSSRDTSCNGRFTVAFQAVRSIPGGSRHQNLRIPSWLAVPTQCPAGCQAITSMLCLCASAISVCGA
jgi:hypothetical protein